MIYKCPCCGQAMPDLNTLSKDEENQNQLEDEYKEHLATILWFGKYSGKTLEDVLNINPQYLLWVNTNVTQITLHQKLIAEASSRASLSKTSSYKRSFPSYYDHHEYDTDYDLLDNWGDMDPMD